MARKSGVSISSTFFLQLALGVFFLMLGISGVTSYDSWGNQLTRNVFGKDDSLNLIMAIVEIVMSGVLIFGLFAPVSNGMARIFSIALFVLWGIYIFLMFIANSFLKPDFVSWCYEVSWRLVILVGLWIVGSRYMDKA